MFRMITHNERVACDACEDGTPYPVLRHVLAVSDDGGTHLLTCGHEVHAFNLGCTCPATTNERN